MGWLSGWSKRVKLTIDKDDIDDALSDFPVLVHLSASSGIGDVDVSCVFDELKVDANRKKIAVTTSDGVTECYIEIEKWDDASEKAWLWVKVPSVASGVDTDLYLYYDKTKADNTTYVGDTNSTPAENVWANGYFITHMKDDPDNAHIRDSSSYSSDGDKRAANQPTEAAGDKTAYAQDFNPANPDYIEIPAAYDQLNFTSENWAFITRVKIDSLTAQRWLFARGDFQVDGYYNSVTVDGRFWAVINQLGSYQYAKTAAAAIITATWYTLGFTREATVGKVFINGVDATDASSSISDPTSCTKSAKIGIQDDKTSNPMDGKIEFLGIFGGVALTAAFHKAFDQSITDDLLAFGGEELIPLATHKYTVELHSSDLKLIAVLENAYRIAYTEAINEAPTLSFSLPADDAKAVNITKANEIWLRDYDTGVIVNKFGLVSEGDIRQ